MVCDSLRELAFLWLSAMLYDLIFQVSGLVEFIHKNGLLLCQIQETILYFQYI